VPRPSRRAFAGAATAIALGLAVLVHGAGTAGQQGKPAPAKLDTARDAAAALPRLHSLLVNWRGSVVLEYYGKGIRPGRLANVKSVSKSIISALVGIAVERRLIPGVDTPIVRYFPQLQKDDDPRKRAITIEDLLTMRSGLESTSFDNYGGWVRSRNWVNYVLAQPLVSEPGTTVEYSTGSSHLLSAILTRVSKSTTHQFAQSVLATPLGLTLARWPRDPQGIYFGGNDMLLTPRQMMAFGEMYLREGRARGRQIVPEAWVETSCVPRGRSRFNPDQQYGYGWWIREFAGHTSCFAWGFGGQYIFTFPALDLVVVTTSSADVSDERRDHRRMIFDILERQILPEITTAMRPAALD
jgi:CubicO group peptidase (beta-lactamase class C family)